MALLHSQGSRRRRASTESPPPDAGFTLIEVIVSVALLGLLVVPVTEAVRVAVSVSLTNHRVAQVESTLVNAVDRVNRAPLSCDYAQYAQAAAQTQGWAPERATAVAQWFDAARNAWANDGRGCQLARPTVDLVQRVTITVSSPDGSLTRRVQVVKSRV